MPRCPPWQGRFVAWWLVCAVAPAAAAAPPRLAIIAPSTATAGIVDVLTAGLSQDRGIALVEREAIDRVVGELAVAAALGGEGEDAVKLGGLLAADAILTAAPEPKSEPPQVRLRLVETRTGMRLGDWPVAASGIEPEDMADIRAGLRLAIAKLGIPPDDRHLVGVIGFQPEAATADLAALTRALGALVERDLASLPDVVVLDREQLRRLTAERDLTGLELDLKVASKLVEGSVRRDGDRLTLTLKLVPLAGGPGRTATVTTGGGLPAIRRDSVAALVESLGAEPRGLAMAPPAEEAALLAARARRRTGLRDHAEAVRLAEAASVLAPGPDTFGVLYHAYLFSEQDIATGGSMMADQPDFARPWFDRDLYPTVEAARIARQEMRLRLAEAARDYYEHCVRDPKLEAEFPIWNPQLLFTYRIPLETDAERRLAAARERIQRDLYDRILQVRRAAGSPGATNLILHRLAEVDWLLAEGGTMPARPLVDFLRETREELAREEKAGRWPADRIGSLAVYHDLLRRALHERAGGGVPVDAIRPFLEELVASDDAGVRIIAWGRLVDLPGDAGATAAASLVDTLLFAAVPRHRPAVSPPSDTTLTFKGLGHKAGRRLAAAGRLTAYLEKIVSRAEAAGDVAPLVATPHDLLAVIRCDQQRAADFIRRIEALVAAKAYPPDKVAVIEGFTTTLAADRDYQKLLHALDTRTGPYAPAQAGRLDAYETRELRIASPEPGFGHLAMVHVDRTPDGDPRRPLVLVWSKHVARLWSWRKDDPREFEYLVSRVGTDGGDMRVEGRCRLPVKAIQCMASAGPRHGFATEQHGVAVFDGRDVTMITEAEGVPGGWMGRMAWLDGRLYVAIENSLVAVDPATKQCDLIASARSLAARNPLDGAGPFMVDGLVADPPRKRLVLLVTSNLPPDKTPAGLWSFTPAGGTWQRLAPAGCFSLVWGAEAMFFGRRDSPNEVPHRLDLASSRVTPLPGYAKNALPQANERGEPGWSMLDELLFFPNDSQAAARDATGAEHSWSPGSDCKGRSIHRIGDELVAFDEYAGRLTVIRRTRAPGGQDRTP